MVWKDWRRRWLRLSAVLMARKRTIFKLKQKMNSEREIFWRSIELEQGLTRITKT